MGKTYTTLADLIDREIAPTLADLSAFDLDGFVSALRDADLIIWTGTGFELVTDEDGQTPGFWELVERFDAEAQK